MFSSKVLIGIIVASLVVAGVATASFYLVPQKNPYSSSTTYTWDGVSTPTDSYTPVASGAFTVVQKGGQLQSSSTLGAFAYNTNPISNPSSTPVLEKLNTYFRDLSSSGTAAPSTSVTDYLHLYSFGLGKTASGVDTRAPSQQALYEYGNRAGVPIQKVEASTEETNAVLTAFFDTPSTMTTSDLKHVAKRFTDVSKSLLAINSVPASIQSEANALAAAYAEVGGSLAALSDTKGNENLLVAINSYNETATTLGDRFVSMVDIFSAAKVTFSDTEPGSVFMFTFGQ